MNKYIHKCKFVLYPNLHTYTNSLESILYEYYNQNVIVFHLPFIRKYYWQKSELILILRVFLYFYLMLIFYAKFACDMCSFSISTNKIS